MTDITTLKDLQYWAQHYPQELLDEITQICQYHDDTVTSHNELMDQLQMLERELQDLDNDHEKQTDDLLQTQAHLDQA